MLALIGLVCFLFSSCSKILGYSVLLWNVPEHNLQDGEVVKVFIKSNISHVYVIEAASEKIEVPLWQITEPQSKSKAEKTAKIYAEYNHTYASVKLDGLPIRAEAVNTARQVYRLRKDEVIKVLYKGKGQQVMAGKKPLEGDWLYVLTLDGSKGWCFSYNLTLFQTDKNGGRLGDDGEVVAENNTAAFDEMLQNIWYPESYKAMIESERIDTNKLVLSCNLHLDTDTNRLSFVMPNINESWNYTGATLASQNQYDLNDIPLTITVKRSDFIVVRYTGESGKPEDFNLVTIEADIPTLIYEEKAKRQKQYEQILMFSNSYKSSNYGNLTLRDDYSFNWSGNRLLVPSVLTANAKNSGNIKIKYFLSPSLSQSYDGVLTFNFDGMTKEVNFLYKIENSGLRLEDATNAHFKNSTLTDRALSPLVLFFQRK